MLISPKHLYDEVIGKSEEVILKEISECRRYIRDCKKEIERIDDLLTLTEPSVESRLEHARESLSFAIKALIESGYKYKPTKIEQKTIDFNNKLSDLIQITFTTGDYFSGYLDYVINFNNNSVYIILKKDRDYLKRETCVSKEKFLCEFKKLYIGEWKRRYITSCNDGLEWELTLKFHNHKTIKYYGVGGCPNNFDELELTLDEMLDINDENID